MILNPIIDGSLTPPMLYTAAEEAGIASLWKLSYKATSMALAVRLLEDMTDQGVGLNEVESLEWRRRVSREAKKGRRLKAPEKGGKRMKISILREDRLGVKR